MTLTYISYPIQKLITDLKVEANSKKLLKEILGEKLCNNGVGRHKKTKNKPELSEKNLICWTSPN